MASVAAVAVALVGTVLAPMPAMAAPSKVDQSEGTLTHHSYFSESLGIESGVEVYTPPQYDGRKPLPVVYIAPGGCRDENYWFSIDGINVDTLDALFDSGDAKPMIIVSVNGAVGTNLFGNPLDDVFPTELVETVVPFVDSTYKTIPTAQHRALAGNSCGGGQVLNTLLQYPGAFSEIGLWSSGWFPAVRDALVTDPALAAALADPRVANGTKYFEARVGAEDPLVLPHLPATLELLAGAGIETDTLDEFPGIGHDDVAGRLALFAGLTAFFQKH